MKENMYIKCNQMLLAEDRFNMDSFLKTWLQMWPTSWTQCLRKKSLYVQSFHSSSMFSPSLLTHKKCFLELKVTHPPLSHFQHKTNSSMPLSKQSWTCYWEKNTALWQLITIPTVRRQHCKLKLSLDWASLLQTVLT